MSDYNKQRDIIAGLQIFMKYGGKYCGADHDEFYAGPEQEITDPEDLTTLADLGWAFDEERDTWRTFV